MEKLKLTDRQLSQMEVFGFLELLIWKLIMIIAHNHKNPSLN